MLVLIGRRGATRIADRGVEVEIRASVAIVVHAVVARGHALLVVILGAAAARIAAPGLHVVGRAVVVVVEAIVARGRAPLAGIERVRAPGITRAVDPEVDTAVAIVVDAVVACAAGELGRAERRRATGIAAAVDLKVQLPVVVVVEPVVAHVRAVLVGVVRTGAARIRHVDEAVAVVVDAVRACRAAARLLRVGQAVAVVVLAIGARRIAARTFGLAGGDRRVVVVAVLDARARAAEPDAIAVVIRARDVTEASLAVEAERAVAHVRALRRDTQAVLAVELVLIAAIHGARASLLRAQPRRACLVGTQAVLIAAAAPVVERVLVEAARRDEHGEHGEPAHHRNPTVTRAGRSMLPGSIANTMTPVATSKPPPTSKPVA